MDIVVKTQRTRSPLKRSQVQRAAARMLLNVGVRRAELSVVFLDARAMRQINRKYLGHDRVTDVISFDLLGHKAQGTPSCLCTHQGRARHSRHKLRVPGARCPVPRQPSCIDGEIFICPAEARRNAKLYGEPVSRELLRYLAHGILHLLGYDDSTASERDRMRELEDKLLSHLGTLDTRH